MAKSSDKELLKAASDGNIELATKAIAEGADVNAQDEEGNTPLHYAALRDATGAVKILLENGADVNAQDDKGHNPLDVATEKGHQEVAEVIRWHVNHPPQVGILRVIAKKLLA